MGPDWFAAWATAAGVLATAGVGVVIAFQTAATRRSVQVSRAVVVPPGASVPVRLRQVVAVEALVSACLAMELAPLVVAEIPIDDAFDEGVVDTHTVVVTGQPLTPVDDDHAGCTLSATGPDGHLPVGIRPVMGSRKHCFSKSAGHEMPSTAATASPRPGGRTLRSLARRRAG